MYANRLVLRFSIGLSTLTALAASACIGGSSGGGCPDEGEFVAVGDTSACVYGASTAYQCPDSYPQSYVHQGYIVCSTDELSNNQLDSIVALHGGGSNNPDMGGGLDLGGGQDLTLTPDVPSGTDLVTGTDLSHQPDETTLPDESWTWPEDDFGGSTEEDGWAFTGDDADAGSSWAEDLSGGHGEDANGEPDWESADDAWFSSDWW
ncbi:MAG: hypothetical protein KC561_15480 [Myxococcales bacterium]|nr:hypothetical protein [Myxococcales bacterium]